MGDTGDGGGARRGQKGLRASFTAPGGRSESSSANRDFQAKVEELEQRVVRDEKKMMKARASLEDERRKTSLELSDVQREWTERRRRQEGELNAKIRRQELAPMFSAGELKRLKHLTQSLRLEIGQLRERFERSYAAFVDEVKRGERTARGRIAALVGSGSRPVEALEASAAAMYVVPRVEDAAREDKAVQKVPW